ncbi:hypothetical protein [Herpetosiphon geysericola]|uniref:SWIM-type domain-containing protein n=1 Tax=Herpetosiphon geysericola TaxID=70996 RepID=A0A0N8GP61_9CHLR|nr:hypothetical protein [Herpetosiphon geysericola]KPL80002.1 hypothetical protein SE18_25820 [Herpetosiphon geysericola]
MADHTLLKWQILADASTLVVAVAEAEAHAIAKAAALFMIRGDEFIQLDGTLIAASSLDAKRLKSPEGSTNMVMAAIGLLYKRNKAQTTISDYWEQFGLWFSYVAESLSRKQQLDTLILLLSGHAKRISEIVFEVQGSRLTPYTVTLMDKDGNLEHGYKCTCMGAIPAFSAGAPCKHAAASAILAYAAQWDNHTNIIDTNEAVMAA